MRFLDFHTHPFMETAENIKAYKTEEERGYGMQRAQLESIGIFAAAGSVIDMTDADELTKMRRENEIAMEIFAEHGDFYIPGIRINPHFMRESCETLSEEELTKIAYKHAERLLGR